MIKTNNWTCIENCGACCKLAPQERIEALSVLDLDQQKKYLELVLPDGWCKYFDKSNKKCKVYEARPNFCNVKYLSKLFFINQQNIDEFAIKCCKQQIKHIYGTRSKTMKRFTRSIRSKKG